MRVFPSLPPVLNETLTEKFHVLIKFQVTTLLITQSIKQRIITKIASFTKVTLNEKKYMLERDLNLRIQVLKERLG